MTREEFVKGWVLLTVQPWGARYADDTAAAKTQLGLYFDTFQGMPAEEWWRVCRHLAGGDRWPSVGRIQEFCPAPDKHPGAEAAWARLAPSLKNEALSVCWTEEMREAFGVAVGLADNPVAARMAFKETYEALAEQARARGKKPVWSVSLGWDPSGRQAVVSEAVRQGLIPYELGQRLWPALPAPDAALTELTKRIGNR